MGRFAQLSLSIDWRVGEDVGKRSRCTEPMTGNAMNRVSTDRILCAVDMGFGIIDYGL